MNEAELMKRLGQDNDRLRKELQHTIAVEAERYRKLLVTIDDYDRRLTRYRRMHNENRLVLEAYRDGSIESAYREMLKRGV